MIRELVTRRRTPAPEPKPMPRRAKRLIVGSTRKLPGDVERLRGVSPGGDFCA